MQKLSVSLLLSAAVVLGLASAAFAQQGGQTFEASLAPANGSGASGTATLALNGDQLTVNIDSQGLVPNQPHAQHIHGTIGVVSACPTAANDQNGDGVVSTTEGQPVIGPILVSLTTTGDTSPNSGLAVDRMPVADANGNLSYSRTFTVPADVAANLGSFAIEQHGVDFNANGIYDGGASDLDPSVPFEATAPANCGKIVPAGGTLMETGGPSPLLVAGAVALVGSSIILWCVAALRRDS